MQTELLLTLQEMSDKVIPMYYLEYLPSTFIFRAFFMP